MPSERKDSSAGYYQRYEDTSGPRQLTQQALAAATLAATNAERDKHLITIQSSKKNEHGKYRYINMYQSGHQGSTIRNAVTGAKNIGCLVGSASEYDFYKVGYSSSVTGLSDPCSVYLDSVDQYERHTKGKGAIGPPR